MRSTTFQPEIQILLATYNGEQYVRQQIDSILNQSYRSFELLVADDGSDDSTWTIVQQYAQADSRIRGVSGERVGGAIANFDRLLTAASADYLLFADQDDVWYRNKLAVLARFAGTANPSDIVLWFSDVRLVDTFGRSLGQTLLEAEHKTPKRTAVSQLLVENVCIGNAMMITKGLAEIATPVPTSCVNHDWWSALCAAALGEIRYVEGPLSDYRQHSSNLEGVKQLGWKNVRAEVRLSLRHGRSRVDKKVDQAKALRKIAESNASPALSTIDRFISLHSAGRIARSTGLIRGRFLFQSLAKNTLWLLL